MKTWKNRAQKLLIIWGRFFRTADTAENWFSILEIRLRHPLFFLLCGFNQMFCENWNYIHMYTYYKDTYGSKKCNNSIFPKKFSLASNSPNAIHLNLPKADSKRICLYKLFDFINLLWRTTNWINPIIICFFLPGKQ